MISRPVRTVLVAALYAAACGRAAPPPPDDSGRAMPPVPDSSANAPSRAAVDSSVDPRSGAPEPAAPPVPAVRIAPRDTAYGTVRLYGTALDARVAVQTSTGPVGVAGEHTAAIGRLQGMDVWIRGPASVSVSRIVPPRQITVETFEVRAVGGAPVIDGMVRAEGGELVVEAAGGTRTRLPNAPDALRALVGRRVWVLRAADGAVARFAEIGAGQ